MHALRIYCTCLRLGMTISTTSCAYGIILQGEQPHSTSWDHIYSICLNPKCTERMMHVKHCRACMGRTTDRCAHLSSNCSLNTPTSPPFKQDIMNFFYSRRFHTDSGTFSVQGLICAPPWCQSNAPCRHSNATLPGSSVCSRGR